MRSVPAGSYERLTAPLALWRAWLAYARGKGRRPAVARFALDADTQIFALARRLEANDWQPDPHRLLVVRDPKVRVIAAPSVRDRVLHQAVLDQLRPTFDPALIHDTWAALDGRGAHRAVLRALGWTRTRRYRLHLDVRRFFPSVHHDVMLAVLVRRVRDRAMRDLLERLVRSGRAVYDHPVARRVLGPPDEPDRGLPIGSAFSQWAANHYLDGLDHYVKERLRVGAYLRYMDDTLLFSDDRAELVAARAAIREWLASERRLALNPKHLDVEPTRSPTTWLGFRLHPSGIRPGPKMRRRLRWKVPAAAQRGAAALEATVSAYRALWTFGGD